MIVNHHVGAQNQTQFSENVASALTEPSLQPHIVFFFFLDKACVFYTIMSCIFQELVQNNYL